MTVPGRNLHIRLPKELAAKFDELSAEFAGLQPGTVLRLLIADQLKKPLSSQIEIVNAQIRKPGLKPERQPKSRLNSRNHGDG